MAITPMFSRARLFPVVACCAIALAIAGNGARAEEPVIVNHIAISGNQRIEAETVRSYFGIKEGERITRYQVDEGLKDLFATGFFADVNADIRGDTVALSVVENPSINKVAFEGNKKIGDSDLEKEIELQPRAIYTRTRLQGDVRRVLDLYRRSGRYSATVSPKVIPLEQNRIDLVFEIEEGPISTVEKIFFIGNEKFPAKALEKAIRTTESRWYNFFSNDDKYDPDRLLYDQELLRRFYNARGYADFQVKSATAELTPDKEAFYVTFAIEEGEQYDFGNIGVSSALKGAEAPDFTGLIETKQGEEYNADLIENTIDAMVKELGNRGFAFVDIDPEITRHPKEKKVDLTYNIKEGPRVYVERINIFGNVRTLDEVIRREFRLVEGDPYSTSKLQRTEQRLNNLGFFETVQIDNAKGSAPDKGVVNVQVQEKSTGEISIGAGFSSTDGALADLGVRESNFLGKGQELRARATIATERQQFDFGFTEPYFLDRELAAGFDVYRIQQDYESESSYDLSTTGFNVRMGYALAEKLNHLLTYSLKSRDITNVSPAASLFIQLQEGETVSSTVSQSLVWENRDNKFDPTDGFYLRLNQDLSGLGGDTQFIRHEVKGGYYYPISKGWVWQLTGSAGNIIGIGDDVRIADRFVLGIPDVRGFDRSGIGPRDSATNDALGGNNYYTASTELRFPIGFLPEDLGFSGAVFMDTGSMWGIDQSGLTILDESSLRASAGIGIGWSSPFGLIRVDFAKAFLKEDFDETQVFNFNFGTRF